MRLSWRAVLYLAVWLILLPGSDAAVAQEDNCPIIVQSALETTDESCASTGRNQICYGNVLLEAQPVPGTDAFALEAPGDMEEVASIQTVRLSPMNTTTDAWGVALMRLQANLPATLPGQNITFLLFGDIEIENAAPRLPMAMVTPASTNVLNLRGGPSVDFDTTGVLNPGETLPVNGRNGAGDWLRIVLDDGAYSWVYAPLVAVEGDVMTLAEVDPSAMPLSPMQAFYFRSGTGDAPCEDAPDSGIMVQTPEGALRVRFTVNEVDIELGSTAYIQAASGEALTIYAVEGFAQVTAQSETQTAPAGTRVDVPLDGLAASAPPSAPVPYDLNAIQALPVTNLERTIDLAEPLSEDDIEAAALAVNPCLVTAAGSINLRSGPGTVYALAGSIGAEDALIADGQAQSLDGTTWWNLADGSWVRADLVASTSACATVPIVPVVQIPPTPTPIPVVAVCGVLGTNASPLPPTPPDNEARLDLRVYLAAGTVVNMSISTNGVQMGGSGYTVNGPYGSIFDEGGIQGSSARSFTAQQDGYYTIGFSAGGGPQFTASVFAEAICS